jgi:outer membrane protein OmpA-like peptidoglycan-associated protein
MGATGAQGSTTTGVVGAVGRTGNTGLQGSVGSTGAQGGTYDGAVGPSGIAGAAGPQGPVGSTGAQGPAGVVTLWTLFRDFRFDYNQSDIQASGASKVSEIALYLKANPSLKIAIDGSLASGGSDPRNQDLSNKRVAAIRAALIDAGVPASKIELGAYGDTQLRRDRRVAVLVRTDN